jgi:hypothetical protein
VGADILTNWAERRLLPLLHRAQQPAAPVNAEGRVVVANRPWLVTGAVTDRANVVALWAGRACGSAELYRLPELPLGVFVFSRRRLFGDPHAFRSASA